MKRTIGAVSLLAFCATLVVAQSAGRIKWTPPKRWTLDADRPMRAATYTVPAAAGDPEAGECAVFFFGKGQGGDVQSNLSRWAGQFQTPGGQPQTPKPQKLTMAGFNVTVLDMSGTYLSGGPMTAVKTAKPNYRMLAAVVEGPVAPVFFKLTGPKKTVAASEAEFQTLLRSIKPE